MKRIISGVLAFLLLLTLAPAVSLTAQAEITEDYTDTVLNDQAITGTTGSCNWSLDGTVLTISGSGTMRDYAEKQYDYGKNEYFWKTVETPWGIDITDVIIMPGVKKIGAGSFANCKCLKTVTFADGLKTIGIKAFANCSSLKKITIPDTVEEIGYAAFSGCGNLEEMTIPFVGEKRIPAFDERREARDVLFGYIFGEDAYPGGKATNQCFTIYTANQTIDTEEKYYKCAYYIKVYGSASYSKTYSKEHRHLFYTTLYYETTSYIVEDNKLQNSGWMELFQSMLDYEIITHNYNSISNNSITTVNSTGVITYTEGYPKDNYRQIYYIPSNLKKVTVTNAERLYFGAFSFCGSIDEIYVTKADTQISMNAFYGCLAETTDRWEYGSTKIYCEKGSALESYVLSGKRRLDPGHVLFGPNSGASWNNSTPGKGKYIPPERPTVLNVTDVAITLDAVYGMEYSLDGEKWSDNNVFTELKPDTEYTFYQRYSEVSQDHRTGPAVILASEPSESVTVATKPALSGISMSSLPYKLSYLEAKDTLKVSGGKLCLNYGDEQFEEIDLTADMVQGFDNTVVGTQTLTVTYRGFITTFDITIEPKSVSSIRITTPPAKTNYLEGQEVLDVTGGELQIYYNNGSREVIDLTEDMVSGFDNSKVGDQNLTVTYAGTTCTYRVSIIAIDYIITFLNWDNSIISSNIYHKGDTVTVPADPTKAADNTYTYAFAGWDKAVVNCAGNATYTATYTPTYRNYTILFKDWDGKVLSTKTYHWGDKVTVPTDPTRAADDTYTYAFKDWDKTVVNCAGNATYTATYTPTYKDYTIVFKDWDGKVLSTKTYHYGDKVTVPSNPTKAADDTYTYAFKDWDKTVVNCAGDTTYTATYTPTYKNYTIVFKDWDGKVLSTKTYHWGDEVTVPYNPAKAADNTYAYTFAGWDKEVVNCAGDATYKAIFTPVYIDYTVVFMNWYGTVISSKTYHWGDVVEAPENPEWPNEGNTTYTFTGWDQDITACDGNKIYFATYNAWAFADVVKTSWQFTAAKYVYERGLMTGKGTDVFDHIKFDPNSHLTREEFVQVLYNAEGRPEVTIENKFPDVKNDWYKNAVLWANESRVVMGMGNGKFGVGMKITRQDLAVMLYRYAQMKGYSLNAEEGKSAGFADGNKVSDYAKTAMDWAVTNKILGGKGTAGADISDMRLDPLGNATRAECAVMLKNFMSQFNP